MPLTVNRMVVMGDSVIWGQGLLENEKFYSIVRHSRPGTEGALATCTVLAHSGATIGVGVGIPVNEPVVNGEVPTSFPTILQQCDSFIDSPETIDLVLLDGGANDVGIRTILDPFTDAQDLKDKIEKHCFNGMKILLDKVASKFTNPDCKIVVNSYYPALSSQSNPLSIIPFLAMHGLTMTPFLAVRGISSFDKPVQNCQQFFRQSTDALQRAVNDINATPAGNNRISLAVAPFKDVNAAFAPQKWIWEIKADFEPEDEVQGQRHLACEIGERDIIQREFCFRASVGHPNVAGAQQFANAVLALI